MLFTRGIRAASEHVAKGAGVNVRAVTNSSARATMPKFLHTTPRHAAKLTTETPRNAATKNHWLTHPVVILGAGTLAAGVGLREMLKATEKNLAEEPRNVKTVGAGKAGG